MIFKERSAKMNVGWGMRMEEVERSFDKVGKSSEDSTEEIFDAKVPTGELRAESDATGRRSRNQR